ncbi:MAG: BPL-N domain-containing protein [Bacteroidales bacterium]|jgi:putative intracellular protease/amidase|nr:BPL-N domain-containing protein [Bacteroidales bacterium]MDD4385543.1 BPL-N domain-containing protein [Bacteroidales bacterium]MDY0198771.1 BPL-N domain-containing protein [Tenuifilaceae bacterium]
MRYLTSIILSLAILGYACSSNQSQNPKVVEVTIKVGVFDGHGGAQTCVWETVEAIKIDKGMSVRLITTSDIANGCLDSLDAIIIPGGGGSRQYLNLGHENQQRIRTFIANGGGAVGICAGAYLFSNTPGYASIAINGAQAIDIEHDNRGHGLAKFTLTDEGKSIFPELANRDTSFVMYYEGPVFINAPDSISYTSFATMESDVHTEGGAPANMTNAKPFFIGNSYGKGRVFSTIAHPEATPGMRWLIPRMVRWTVGKEYIAYSENAVRPTLFEKEILFSKDMLKRESAYYATFLYGTAEEKIEALDWLESNVSWDAKRWVQGLLFDSSAEVRARAAQYITNSEFTYYLPDLRAALKAEKDDGARVKMAAALRYLEAI